MTTRIIEVRHGILRKNDELARTLRARFNAAGVFVVNLVSGPGAGKTTLLERTLAGLLPGHRVAANPAAAFLRSSWSRPRRARSRIIYQATAAFIC